MTGPLGPLDEQVRAIMQRFTAKNAARETALAASRRVIRSSANSIRAIHRDNRDAAAALLAEAAAAHAEAVQALTAHPDIRHAGFLHDAQKEYAEASATVAILTGRPLPSPEAIGVEDPAYLNGLAEAIGELRRVVLDRLRSGRIGECEPLLGTMDDIYDVLVTIDFPDAMTGGLRRSTDQARAILERTRGDLALALVVSRGAGVAASLPPEE